MTGTIESDETWIGGKVRGKGAGYTGNKTPILTLIEREGGRARSTVVPKVTGKTLRRVLTENVTKDSQILTDENKGYNRAAEGFMSHDTVNHSAKEYARGDIHINAAESYFALLKRGVHGTFHHVSRQRLPKYCSEFDFRWNHRKTTDSERTEAAIQASSGKRLTYKSPLGK